MLQTEAIAMLQHDRPAGISKEVWADLGCGSGTFTLALANLLPAGSTIYAVDTSEASLKEIPHLHKNVFIQILNSDFVTDAFAFPDLDGILMANSLHYVSDQDSFIQKLKLHLKPAGRILLVEYDTDTPNRWVPYPLGFLSLKRLFTKAGFASVTKLHEHPSVYKKNKMYSALVQSAVGN